MAKSQPNKPAASSKPAPGGKPEKDKVCPVTCEEFLEHAQPFVINIGGQTVVAEPRQFSSGGYGFFCNDRIKLTVNGKVCTMMATFSMPLVYSKPRKDDE